MTTCFNNSTPQIAAKLLFSMFIVVVPFSGLTQDAAGEASQQQLFSVGDALHVNRQMPLHIFYIHGIGATGPGDSLSLRTKICKYLKDCTSVAGSGPRREYADAGIFSPGARPPTLTCLEKPVWQSPEDWNASVPFVDHYVLTRKQGRSILVDEINWWPLVISLKCRKILYQEAWLAGADGNYLQDCASQWSQDGLEDRFNYPWISGEQVVQLRAMHSSAAFLNRKIKIDLMDWGFSDALMAVGPMQQLLLDGIRQLILKSVVSSSINSKPTGTAGGDGDYIIISHSLGSFLIFAALSPENVPDASGTDAKQNKQVLHDVLAHLSQVYFFANQVPLLDLAMLGNPAQSVVSPQVADIRKWSEIRQSSLSDKSTALNDTNHGTQIVAWGDPSDLLTWRLPEIDGVQVVNYHTENAVHWLWLFAWPPDAHGNYVSNPRVIKSLMEPRLPSSPDK
jgi:hypothetical protein